ncbi:hypothetical protein ACN9MF_17960 [Methylobacterium fujisawaense]|uniref:hypothetical protein n=1 Tax=Methylobacterium fujisawaense TaxID=107400 RepID=UPI003CEA6B4F
MAIALRGTGAVAAVTNTTTTPVTLAPAFPAGWQADDIALLVTANYTYSSTRYSITNALPAPSGWTLLFSQGGWAIFWRRLVDGDAAPTFAITGGGSQTAYAKALFVVYSGASTADNPFGTVVNGTGGSTAVNVPAYTMSEAGVALTVLMGGYSGAWTTMSGCTELFDTQGPPITGPSSTAMDAAILAGGATRAASTPQTDATAKTGYVTYYVSFSLLADPNGSTAPTTPKNLIVNSAGTWKPAQSLFVNQSGTWKQAQSVWVNSAGTWKQVL